MALATMFTSCQKEGSVTDSPDLGGAVSFSAESITPLTKVSGSEWEAGDAIGIFAYSQGVCSYNNIKYTTSEGGATVSLIPYEEAICHPEDGSSVNYIAYYPYQEGWDYDSQNLVFDLSAQDGTIEAQSRVDLLNSFATCGTAGEPVAFQFEHVLSKVQITVSNYDDVSAFENLTALSATIKTKSTHYKMLSEVIVPSDEAKELKMVEISNDGTTAIFSAIIAPGEVSDEVIFTDGVYYYSANLNIERAYYDKQYNFTVTVGDQGLTLVELVNDGVTEWENQDVSTMGKDLEIVDGVYCIYTAKGMKMFATAVNGGSYSIDGKLMCDIDLEGSEDNQWTPIGNYNYLKRYTGKFDGGGFEILGLYVVGEDAYIDGAGLFSCTYGATIQNLSVSGSVNGYNCVAGIVGFAGLTTFTNCHSSVTVTGDGIGIGGIAGHSNDYLTFENCSNSGKISGGSYIGGIMGGFPNSTMINCYNIGSVEGYQSVGGVVGNGILSTMINCYNLGSVKGWGNYIGGVWGYNMGSTISNCYNAGEITNAGSTTYIGGVVGYVDVLESYIPVVSDCYFDSTNYAGDAFSAIQEGYEYTVTNTLGLSTSNMKLKDFVVLLNNGAYTYNQTVPATKACAWQTAEGDYPIFDTESEPTYTYLLDSGSSGITVGDWGSSGSVGLGTAR